ELFFAMRVAVIDGRRGDAGEEDQAAAAHEQRGSIRHHHVPPAIGMMQGAHVLGHDSGMIPVPRRHVKRAWTAYRPRYASRTRAFASSSAPVPATTTPPHSRPKPP